MADVEFKVDHGIGIITINRPAQRNALNSAVMDGMREAFAQIVSDPEIRVAILTGAGGVFCAGMDLKAFSRGEKISNHDLPFATEKPLVLNKPLIAAVEGYCLAGGFETALCCDLIVAAETAQFGLSEVKRGLLPAGGALYLLARQAPWRIALELVFTGDIVSAQKMERFGVVNRLTPEGHALAGAMTLAAAIVENAPLAVATCKEAMRAAQDWSVEESHAKQRPYVDRVFQSNDAKEGPLAFAEKRKPKWTGA